MPGSRPTATFVTPGLAVVLLLVVLCAPEMARGDNAPLLVYGLLDDDEAEDRALRAFRLQSPTIARSPEVRRGLDIVSQTPWITVSGASSVRTCPVSEISAQKLQQELDALETLLAQQDLHNQGGLLGFAAERRRLQEMLPCVGEVVQRADLARFRQVDDAMDLVGSPDGAPVEDLAAAIPFRVAPWTAADASLWLDGVILPSSGYETHLTEGGHLLQYRQHTGEFETFALFLEDGDEILVYGRNDAAHAAISGRGDDILLDHAAQALGQLSENTGASEIYLVELDPSHADLVHRYDPASSHWSLCTPELREKRIRAGRQRTFGIGMLLTGSVFAAFGSVLGVDGHLEVRTLYADADNIPNTDVFIERSGDYDDAMEQSFVGFVIAGVGLAAVSVSIPLIHSGRRAALDSGEETTAEGPSVTLMPLGVRGEF